MDINIDLERSSYYENRQKLLMSCGSPKLSDATRNLGIPLANVLFDHCVESEKYAFGLYPPLNGPEGDLWISPSDLLIGKVALKPPFTSKCLQALTHKGILEIGAVVENRFRSEMELDKKKALEKSKRQLIDSLEDKMNAEIKDVELREKLRCSAEVEKLTKEFDSVLLAELDKLEKKLREEHEILLRDHENLLKIVWQENLDREVQKTVHTLTTEFFQKLDEQEQILVLKFKHELKKLQVHHRQDIKMNDNITKKILRQVKHYLECKNLANMMYVLCVERRKCCDEKNFIEQYYRGELEKMQQTINFKDEEAEKLKSDKAKTIQDLELRETCLLKILTQFQKFINFALRASPTQAEFLLSVEKMMVFEMNDAIVKSEIPAVQSEDVILPWAHGNESLPSTQSSGLQIKDYHNCMFETTPPREQSQAGIVDSDEELPAVFYKGKMYVREDFRDMMAAGIKITPSNELWNEDVEILMQTMRASVTRFTTNMDDQEESGITLNVKWSQHATSHKKVSIDDRGASITSAALGNMSRRSSLKPLTIQEPPEHEMITPASACPSKLLAAKDSLEMLKEKKKSSIIVDGAAKIDSISERIETIKTVVQLDEHVDVAYQSPAVPLPFTDGIDDFTRKTEQAPPSNRSLDFITEKEVVHVAGEPFSKENNTNYDDQLTVVKIEANDNDKSREFMESETIPILLPSYEGRSAKDETSYVRDIYESHTGLSLKETLITPKPEPSNKDLAVEAKDSIILRKASLIKKPEEFHISPHDSIETRKEKLFKSKHPELVIKPSKLLSARNSLELLRESFLKIREPMPECRKPKSATVSENSSLSTRISISCCERSGIIGKRRSCVNEDFGIRISQTKSVQSDRNISTVAFNKDAYVYDVNVDADQVEPAEDKHSRKSSQEATSMRLNQLEVVGETNAKEGRQSIDEFTTERIHSLIDVIKDHPNLIRLFTSN